MCSLDQTEVVLDYVCDGLSVGRGAGTTAVDVLRDLGELVRHAVGHVGPAGGGRGERDTEEACRPSVWPVQGSLQRSRLAGRPSVVRS